MWKIAILSLLLVVTTSGIQAQTPDMLQLITTLLANDEIQAYLQDPQNIAILAQLANFLNNTENATAVLGQVLSDPEFTAVARIALTLGFERLSSSAMTAAGVTKACQTNVMIFLEELVAGNSWALSMVDAWGKPGANLMDYQTKFIGSYEECTAIHAVSYQTSASGAVTERGSFDGKYCSEYFGVPGIPSMLNFFGAGYVQLGLCVPHTCSNLDVYRLTTLLEQAIFNNTVPIPPAIVNCQEGPNDAGGDLIAASIILGILGCLVVMGTLYDVCAVQLKSKEPGKDNNSSTPAVVLTNNVYKSGDIDGKLSKYALTNVEINGKTALTDVEINGKTELTDVEINGKTEPQVVVENGESGDKVIPPENKPEQRQQRSMLEKILLSFSAYTNGVKLLSTQQAGTLGALNGIRFLSMAWVILGHTYYFAMRYDANFFSHFMKKMNMWTFMGIAYADVSVDSFFALSGLLVAYLTLKQLEKLGGPSNLNWFMYYFHRFWRLTPPYMLVMMVGTAVLPYTLNGPFWDYGDMPAMGTCRDNWWINLLYLNNYVKVKEQCMGWAWYLANDMQYYWISPLLLIPLFFHIGAGVAVCLAFLLASSITVGVITHDHRYPVQQFSFNTDVDNQPTDDEYSKNLYIPSYARIGPYIIGVLTGYLLYKWKCRCNIPKALNLAAWFASIGLTVVLVYVRYSHDADHIFSRLESEIFMSLYRTAWAVALCWIIFSCATGHGGWVNEVLSWKPFIPLGRLSYCAYLIHPLVMLAFYSSRTVTTYFTDYEVIYLFLAHISLTYGLSFLTSLMFESPMMGLEKVIFYSGKK